MKARVAALIPAAGSGDRLGLGPKALLGLNGRTLVQRAVDNLLPLCDEVLVALPHDLLHACPSGARGVVGGSSRQDTVHRLLLASNADWVLVHDAARPFLSQDISQACLQAAMQHGAASVALPASDTLVQGQLVQGQENQWRSVVPRDGVWQIQTPQAFGTARLRHAHEHALQHGTAATDDAGLVAHLGDAVQLVMGAASLFKITRQADWDLACAYAPIWDAQQGRP